MYKNSYQYNSCNMLLNVVVLVAVGFELFVWMNYILVKLQQENNTMQMITGTSRIAYF